MFGIIYKIAKRLTITFFMMTITSVFLFKVVPIYVTPIMIGRIFEGLIDGKFVGINKTWKDYDKISPWAFRAFISGEDGRFMRHHGVDWRAVKVAQRYNEIHNGRKKRGASTISMQTAKNAFLCHSRNYFRKALELYFVYLIEPIWGKKRILEVYANIVEFGDGIYGVEAASQEFFNKSADQLTKRQAALLAAVLPNPHRWSPAHPTNYLLGRVAFISGRMGGIALPKDLE